MLVSCKNLVPGNIIIYRQFPFLVCKNEDKRWQFEGRMMPRGVLCSPYLEVVPYYSKDSFETQEAIFTAKEEVDSIDLQVGEYFTYSSSKLGVCLATSIRENIVYFVSVKNPTTLWQLPLLPTFKCLVFDVDFSYFASYPDLG